MITHFVHVLSCCSSGYANAVLPLASAYSHLCFPVCQQVCCLLQSVDMAGHNTSLFVLGVMILWFGWYGFNPGSQLAIISPPGSDYSYASAVANAAVTTSLAPSAAGLTGLILTAILLKLKTGKHHWDIMAMGNSTLAGLVAITAGCSTVYPWAAVTIGIVAGIIYPLASRLMVMLKVSLCTISTAYFDASQQTAQLQKQSAHAAFVPESSQYCLVVCTEPWNAAGSIGTGSVKQMRTVFGVDVQCMSCRLMIHWMPLRFMPSMEPGV